MEIKKTFFLIALLLSALAGRGQILCINCYNQNDSISDNVNNLILNGGFENHNCVNGGAFCPNSNFYSCNINNWICTGGGPQTYARVLDSNSTYSLIPEGNYALYFGNLSSRNCSSAILDSSCLNEISCVTATPQIGYPVSNFNYGGTLGVSLEQTVNGLIIGNSYVLEFWSGGEAGFACPGLFAVDVGFGNIFLRDPETPLVTGIGRVYVVQFNATSLSHTIKFTNWGHIYNFLCTELVLDNVRLYTLAELDASVPHCFLGVDNINDNFDFTITPNPFSSQLTVVSGQWEESAEIVIYDVMGKKALSQPILSPNTQLNTHNFPSGIYFYEIRNNGGVIKKGKVVKD